VNGTSSSGGRWRPVAIVIGAMVFLAAIPLGVNAATSGVVITDPVTSTSKARVVGGALKVGDGKGPLTVDGTVASRPSTPKHPLFGQKELTSTNKDAFLAGPFASTTTYKMTNLTFANYSGTNATVRVRTRAAVSGSCNTAPATSPKEWARVAVPANSTVTVPYPTPLVAQGSCLTAFLDTSLPVGPGVWVTVVGYR